MVIISPFNLILGEWFYIFYSLPTFIMIIVIPLVFIFFSGISIGTSQWFVILRHIPQISYQWWVSSIVGWIVGWGVSYTLFWALFFILDIKLQLLGDISSRGARLKLIGLLYFGIVPGVIISVIQGLALRRHIPQIGFWVLANAMSMAIIVMTGTIIFNYFNVDVFVCMAYPILWGMIGAVYGIITGFNLMWLFPRYPVPVVEA